jgi:hypothetical protein
LVLPFPLLGLMPRVWFCIREDISRFGVVEAARYVSRRV